MDGHAAIGSQTGTIKAGALGLVPSTLQGGWFLAYAPRRRKTERLGTNHMLTPPSTATIIPFELRGDRAGFEQAREAWHQKWHADNRLTPVYRVLVSQVTFHFNRDHYEERGELIAWPSWETIAAKARLSIASIDRGFRILERLGALKTLRERDPKTGQNKGNTYIATYQDDRRPPIKATYQGESRLSDIDSLIYRNDSSAEGEASSSAAPSPRSSARPPSPSRPRAQAKVKVNYETFTWMQLNKYGPEAVGKTFNRVAGYRYALIDQGDLDKLEMWEKARVDRAGKEE